MLSKKEFLIFIPGIALSLFGMWLAVYYLLNHDAAFFLTAADRVFAQGKYDFIEPNLPLITYINLIPVAFARYFGFSPINCFFVFCFLLLQGQIALSFCYIKKNPLFSDSFKITALVTGLYLGLFILPNNHLDFGEREHLFIGLILPYIFSLFNEALNITRPGRKITLLTGISAGIGISLRPHFIILPLACELFLAVNKRKLFYCFRLETITIALTVTALYLLTFIIYPEYFTVILPKVRIIYPALLDSPSQVLRSVVYILLFPLAGIIFYSIRKPEKFIVLQFAFFIIATACLIFFLQGAGWSNKIYPCKFFLLLFLCFCGLINARKAVLITLCAAFFLFMNFYFDDFDLFKFDSNKEYVVGVSQIIKQQAENQPVLILSASLIKSFPAINYANAKWPLRMASFLQMPYFYGDELVYKAPDKMDNTEKFFYDAILTDIKKDPPKLIIANCTTTCKNYHHKWFDYIGYFSQDKGFATAFKKYKLIKSDYGLDFFELKN